MASNNALTNGNVTMEDIQNQSVSPVSKIFVFSTKYN